MSARPEGVYADDKGGWYFKATVGRDPLTGKRVQVTKRGFSSASAAGKARRELLSKPGTSPRTPVAGLTVNELLDLYLDGADADGRLSKKTLFDYRNSADAYIRPVLGRRRVRDVSPDVILAWQRALAKHGGTKSGRALSPNTIRIARAPLAGAFKLALTMGLVATNPVATTPRPTAKRSIPKHWSPEEAREFLSLMEGDRTYPVWAFLLGSGMRIGELVALRWPSVDLRERRVRVVDFVSTLGYDLLPSGGKSRDAIRTIDIDAGLVAVLKMQRKLQAEEQLATAGLVAVLKMQRKLQAEEQLATDGYAGSDLVFTKPGGGQYHPQQLSKLLGTYSQELGLPRLTAHGLRHTSATLMLASGVPPKVAAERLGHADPTLFTNLYSHVTPTMQREAADKIGSMLFGDG